MWCQCKDDGNNSFKNGLFQEAVSQYTLAISEEPPDVVQKATLYSNRSVAYLRMGLLEAALEDSESCIALRSDWEKGYYRKGMVLEAMGDSKEALLAFRKGLDLSPMNTELLQKVRVLKQQQPGEGSKSSTDDQPSINTSTAKSSRGSKKKAVKGPGDAAAAAGVPGPSSWARGLAPDKQREWLVDCYRMRVDDDYAYTGAFRGLYAQETGREGILEDFLIFCKLAVQKKVVPAGWDWDDFLAVAAGVLGYAFEKSDAQEVYGSENVFSAMMGGRSLRYTAEVVYGTSIMGGGQEDKYQVQLQKRVNGNWHKLCNGMDNIFQDVGGLPAWTELEENLKVPHAVPAFP